MHWIHRALVTSCTGHVMHWTHSALNTSITGHVAVVRWLVAERPSNMQVYLTDGSAKTTLRVDILRQKLQTKLCISPSHSILTPGQPVQALTL